MDFFTSAEEILSLPINRKERNHRSRKRRAYHVFLSRFCTKFSCLSYEEKKQKLKELRLWRVPNGYESDDSLFTPPQPSCSQVMKAAARVWNSASNEVKEAWGKHADRLNMLPLNDGTFDYIPLVLRGDMRKNVMDSLTFDWRHTASLLRQSIVTNERRGNKMSIAFTAYTFGRERVVLYSQSYRTFFLNHLLKLTIFGSPLYSNLLPHEVVHRSKKETILFIFSHWRISDLFTFGGLDASVVHKDGMKHVICAKANLRRGTKNTIGYVIDEDNEQLHVKVEGKEEYIYIKRPQYDSENGKFEYPLGDQSLTYSLSQLWPIRMKIKMSGQSAIIISTYTSSED